MNARELSALLNEHRPQLERFVSRHAGSCMKHETADDLVQGIHLKAIARAAGAKRATMADPAAAARRTGYVLGGISPFGQRHRHRTFVDESAQWYDEVFVSGGRRGLEVVVAPSAFVRLLEATFVDLTG